VVTHLALFDLRSRTYGSLLRLQNLAAAAVGAGLDLVICCSLDSRDLRGDPVASGAQMAREVRECWGLDARVEVAVRPPLPATPWILQQLAGIWSYDGSQLGRLAQGESVLALLRREFAAGPALILAHRLPSMNAIRRLAPAAPVIFDLDDIEHRVLARGISRLPSARDRLVALASLPALYFAERRATRFAALTLVCSEDDARTVRRSHAEDVHVMPNSVEMPELAMGGTRRVLLMVGIYSYGPNGDGANYVLDEVWPKIAASDPAVEVWFAGANPQFIAWHAKPPERVHFLGFVDSLVPLYRDARVVICPIRYGGGTRVKLVEAAAWGKAIVTTTLGAEGLGMVPGEHALFTDDAAGFAAACLRLLDDQNLARRLGMAARQLAERNFERENVARNLATRIKQILPPGC
jgi:glycosyltransferase involved in cell wall biosynthesis